MPRPPPGSTLFPYTTLFRSSSRYAAKYCSAAPAPKYTATKPPNATATTIHTMLHTRARSEEHTSELQSRRDLVCRLLLEKKNRNSNPYRLSSYGIFG